MVDILFVSPPTLEPAEHQSYSRNAPPLGIGYVAAMLREHGFAVDAIDLAMAADPEQEMIDRIVLTEPRIIGFYTSTVNYRLTERLHRIARRVHPAARTWVGGPHVSYEYAAALLQGQFDVVFLFEAEHSAVEAAYCQLRGIGRLENVAGLAFTVGDAIVKTAPRPREKNLDRLPLPARDLFPMHLYSRPGTIMSSRGCPLKCIFCIASTFEDAYRYRSPDNVVAELTFMYERWGINDFYFIDNVFTTHRARARRIAQLIRETGLPIGWYCVSRVDYVSPLLMQEFASAGCYRIELGVESADLRVMGSLRKRITIDQVHRAADIILNLGMQPMFTFQVGHPGDTPETVAATVELAQHLRNLGAGTYLAVTTPYPGTPLMLNREQYGITLEVTDWEEFRWTNPTYSTAHLSRNDLRRTVYLEAVRMQADVRAGKFRDPQAAPWIRFGATAPPVRVPPPPPSADESLPVVVGARRPEAPEPGLNLPVLQVSR